MRDWCASWTRAASLTGSTRCHAKRAFRAKFRLSGLLGGLHFFFLLPRGRNRALFVILSENLLVLWERIEVRVLSVADDPHPGPLPQAGEGTVSAGLRKTSTFSLSREVIIDCHSDIKSQR